MGGTSIEVHPGLEERYLSLDRHYATDLDWEHRWLYVPNNEQQPLPTFSHDRLCPNTLELWSRTPTMSEYLVVELRMRVQTLHLCAQASCDVAFPMETADNPVAAWEHL